MIERIDGTVAATRAGFNPDNPYVGPRPYQRGERLYGRARESRDILGLLLSERLVLLYSASGAGLTSLLQAAVIPCAEAEGIHVLPPVRFRLETVDTRLGGGNPLVAATLLALSAPELNRGAIPPAPAHTLKSYLGEERVRLGIESRDTAMLLIFDQFEEIFTEGSLDADTLHGFFHELSSLLGDRRTYAIFSMREDHLAQLDRFSSYFPSKGLARYRIGFLDQQAAVEAVVGPARDHGVDFPEPLAYGLVEDLSALSGDSDEVTEEVRRESLVEPLHIQLACHAIWENLVEVWNAEGGHAIHVVPEHAVSASDVLDARLARYYSRTVGSVACETKVSERILRDWVGTHLITNKGLRDLVLRDSCTPEIAAAAERLVDQLLVRREVRRGMVWYELSHDRFIRPIRRDNERWKRDNGSFVLERAERWIKKEKSDAELLSAEGVRDAERMLGEQTSELSGEAEEFLRVSRDRVQRRVRAQRRKFVAALVAFGALSISLAAFSSGWRSNWWQAAWLILDLQKELQSRTYHEVPRQIIPLGEIPILPNEILLPTPSDPATYGAEDSIATRNAARARVQEALARDVDPRRSAYRVQIPANTPTSIANNLRQLGYRVSLGPASELGNTLVFADDVPMTDVRLISLVHLSEGGKVNRLRRFRTIGHSRDLVFEFDPDLVDWPGYTLADLDALKPLPYPNDERLAPR